MAPVRKSKIKPKVSPGNPYGALEGKDGNPQTPTEFDESPHDDGELFFKANDDAAEVLRLKVLILNYIHKDLHHNTLRSVPVLEGVAAERDLEIYHRATFRGQELDVCVYFVPKEIDEEHKSCIAVVKIRSDDLSEDHPLAASRIFVDASWTADAQADKFTENQAKLDKNYWTPRWKYLVNAIRGEMAYRYEKDGTYIPLPEPEFALEEVAQLKISDSMDIVDETVQVFSGATGLIIGPKGANINKIRASSGCKDIKMPDKTEDRPKARELVTITLSGTARQNDKAKKAIQVLVDQWANAPRPPRDGNAGGGGGGGGGFENNPPPPPPATFVADTSAATGGETWNQGGASNEEWANIDPTPDVTGTSQW